MCPGSAEARLRNSVNSQFKPPAARPRRRWHVHLLPRRMSSHKDTYHRQLHDGDARGAPPQPHPPVI
ncbi:hypothetical protein C2E23DRAFT_827042 [Lenzites betulinus]|nr:hypothetical protein C2E23DRAFT_827042 [Lenzites betulinus]